MSDASSPEGPCGPSALAGLSVIPPLTAQSTVGLDTGTDAWSNSSWLRALLYLSFLAFLCNLTVSGVAAPLSMKLLWALRP